MSKLTDEKSGAHVWSPESWKNYPIRQMPEYPDKIQLEKNFNELRNYPPLVSSWEIDELKTKLALAEDGKAFLLQGGDCAETFADCNASHIVKLLKVLLQMSFIMLHEMNISIVRVGRIAGQYAKPRSYNSEKIDGIDYPIYRGDLVNSFGTSDNGRLPNPKRLVEAYQKAGLTINFIRALTEGGGFADLHHPEYWELDFMKKNEYYREYETMVKSITNAIKFMEGILPSELITLRQIDFYTSHEALNLYYDSAQTRTVPHKTGYFNLSTHMPWIGNRTRDPGMAHIEYCRGIENPVGIKIGPPYDISELIDVINAINPKNQKGKIVLITRFGKDRVEDELPSVIESVSRENLNVLWSCDPMHGNTFSTEDGIKTRDFKDILLDIKKTFAVHRQVGTHLGGVHLEMTGEDVTECVGGANGIKAQSLKNNYRSFCDPRLNYEQSLEMAFLISREWKISKGLPLD